MVSRCGCSIEWRFGGRFGSLFVWDSLVFNIQYPTRNLQVSTGWFERPIGPSDLEIPCWILDIQSTCGNVVVTSRHQRWVGWAERRFAGFSRPFSRKLEAN